MKKYIIPNTDGRYSITKCGKVYSNERVLKNASGTYIKPERKLSLFVQQGYQKISIVIGGKRRLVFLHRLLASTFLGLDIFNSKTLVCHKNDIKTDNRLENIYIGSPQNNGDDRSRNNPFYNGGKKLGLKEIIEIKERLKNNGNITHMSKEYGISRTMLHRIKRGESHKNIDENCMVIDEDCMVKTYTGKYGEIVENLVEIYTYLINRKGAEKLANEIYMYLVDIERFDHA